MNINDIIIELVQTNKRAIDIYREIETLGIDKIEFYSLLVDLIRKKKIPNILICHCGHDCSRCKTFIATLTNDNTLREEVISFYKTTFNTDTTQDELYCLSGNSDNIMRKCQECPWISCAKSKKVDSCSECHKYPCKSLAEYQHKYVNKYNQI